MSNETIRFTQREISEIELALFYARRCKHEMARCSQLLLIAKMAEYIGVSGDFIEGNTLSWSDNVEVEDYDLGPANLRGGGSVIPDVVDVPGFPGMSRSKVTRLKSSDSNE